MKEEEKKKGSNAVGYTGGHTGYIVFDENDLETIDRIAQATLFECTFMAMTPEEKEKLRQEKQRDMPQMLTAEDLVNDLDLYEPSELDSFFDYVNSLSSSAIIPLENHYVVVGNTRSDVFGERYSDGGTFDHINGKETLGTIIVYLDKKEDE